MEFRILGPLEVLGDDGQRLALEPRQARTLAVLLLTPNLVVARQRLIEAVWDRPPATAARQLQNCVSALRRLLVSPEPVVVADGPGYRVRTGRGQLDAQVFRDRVATAQAALAEGGIEEAVRQARSALTLWRGPALAGTGGEVIEAGAARLDEQRLATVEWCVDLELQLDRHHELAGELAELSAANPLRERLVGQLMLALHRCGRRADALAAYQRLRARLADELGLDPAAGIQDLHAAILRDEPHTSDRPADRPSDRPAGPHATGRAAVPPVADGAEVAVPRQLPLAVRHFVGRAAELKELNRLLDERAGPGATVVISAIGGTAGIGKTAVAVHWAHQAAPEFPDGQLYVNLRGFDPAAAPMAPAEAIRGFLDAFGVPAEQIPVSQDAQAGLYRSLLSRRRVLVVLDNARDADQVRPLLPGGPSCLVVVTSRNRLTSLVAIEGALPITMDVLAETEAQELMARHLGPERLAREPDAVGELVTRCARLPLALAVMAARAATQPTFPLAVFAEQLADTHQRLDALDTGEQAMQVRAVFSWSYERLTVPAARLFRLLGLHPGPDLTAFAAASLTGVPVTQARRALAELTRAHLVSEYTPGRYAFHDLLRTYAAELAAAEDTSAERAAARYRMFDHYLHTALAADRLLNPHRDPIALLPAQPGVRVERLADYGGALAWFETEHLVLLAVVDQAAGSDTAGSDTADARGWQLAWSLSTYFHRWGHWRDWIAVQHIALAATRRLGERRRQAYVQRELGLAYARLGEYDEAHRYYRIALDLFAGLDDHTNVASTHLNLCWLLGLQDRHAEAMRSAEEALAIYRAADNTSGLAYALNAVGWAHVEQGANAEGLALCERALALHEETADSYGAAGAWDSIGHAHHRGGRYADAVAAYRRAMELFDGLDDRFNTAGTLVRLGDTHLAAGDREPARDAWQRVLDICGPAGHPTAEEARARLDALGDARDPIG